MRPLSIVINHMYTLSQLSNLLEEELQKTALPSYPENLYQPIQYILQLPAKRLRPALTLLSCDLFKGNINDALPVAIAIEMFHNFTLIHDDIMDNAPIRRGNDTVHQKWNNNIAILSGDALFALSMRQLIKCEPSNLPHIIDEYAKAALQVCEGQQLDMDYEKMYAINISQYIEMITLKTAVLLAASLKLGAMCAKANNIDAQHIYNFGLNLGIAFQLQDDILDVFGGDKFGKQPGGDIIANKKTFLLIKSLELANIDQYDIIKSLIDNRNEKYTTYEKVSKMTSLYTELNVKEITETEVNSYYQKAIACLNEINLPNDKKEVLQLFASQLMKREV